MSNIRAIVKGGHALLEPNAAAIASHQAFSERISAGKVSAKSHRISLVATVELSRAVPELSAAAISLRHAFLRLTSSDQAPVENSVKGEAA